LLGRTAVESPSSHLSPEGDGLFDADGKTGEKWAIEIGKILAGAVS
jgi:hypothetical protein